jgi:hypothetical protein
MAKIEEKKKAIELRKQGESIKQIAKQVGISRGTASLWCSNIFLTDTQKSLLHQRMIIGGKVGRMKGRDANVTKRKNNIATQEKHAKVILGNLTDRDITMLGLGLYWGEGSKKNERRFIFTNSDSNIIQCMIRWLQIIGVSKNEIVGQIYINEQHKDRIKIVEKHWIQKLHIRKEQLRKSVMNRTPHKKYYENKNEYFGTFRLMVKKSTTLQYLTLELLKTAQGQV